MLNTILDKIIQFFTIEKYSEVYQLTGTWNLNLSDGSFSRNDYCHYTILKSNKGNYKFKFSGYLPKEHKLYDEVFKYYRCLAEGIYFVKGGELYKYDEHLTLDECQKKLNKAIEEENYFLAERIKKIIANKLESDEEIS